MLIGLHFIYKILRRMLSEFLKLYKSKRMIIASEMQDS